MVDAQAASTRAVRGPRPSRLRIDEADELDIRILDAALGQTMARPGTAAQTVLSSTHHYPDGRMTEARRRASQRGWPVIQWYYRFTLHTPGSRAFEPDSVEAVFCPNWACSEPATCPTACAPWRWPGREP